MYSKHGAAGAARLLTMRFLGIKLGQDRVSNHDTPPVPAHALDHVAVAVPDLDAAMELYRTAFGAEVTDPVEVPEQGIRIAYAKLANARIELMQPTSEQSPVGRFLARNPNGGIHHFCMTTPDVDAAAAAAETSGLRIVGPPRAGHHGRRLFFVHPAATIGSLIEIEASEDSADLTD